MIVLVSLGAQPRGFTGSYQSVFGNAQRPALAAQTITDVLVRAVFDQQRPGTARATGPMIDSIIRNFCESSSFDMTRYTRLPLIPNLECTPERVHRARRACV